jgi:small-conductance mechanosensitive channel
LLVVIASLAVGQLRIETALFNRVVEIVLIAAGLGLALAMGLGTRDIARHIVAGVYLRDLYRPGMKLSFDGRTGTVQEVGTMATRLTGPDAGIMYVPNGHLTTAIVDEAGPTAA